MNRIELKQALDEGGFKETYYSLYDRPMYDALYLHEQASGGWAIEFVERGRHRTLGTCCLPRYSPA
jgi:hypothetical protein